MRDLHRLFCDHPATLGETYAEHRNVALSYAWPLTVAALAAFCHAFFPFLFKTTASVIVKRLADRMASRCRVCPAGKSHRPDLFTAPPAKRAFVFTEAAAEASR